MNRMMKNNPMIMILFIVMILMIVGGLGPFFSSNNVDNYEGVERTGPWHMMGSGGFWMFPFFPIIMLVIILYFVFGKNNFHRSGSESNDTALEILKKRYAKGEITKGEFDQMKNDL